MGTYVTRYNIPHAGVYVFNANVPPGGDATFSNGGIQMLNATAIATPSYNGSNGYWGYYLFPNIGNSNLLPYRTANIFFLHGTCYAFDGTNIYSIYLTNGSTGTVVGTPVKVAYAVGLTFLTVSSTRAYFLSPYDNSVFYFDCGRSFAKLIEFNQMPLIQGGVYNVRDNALYLVTTDSIIAMHEMEDTLDDAKTVNVESGQVTENDLPTGWTWATGIACSTANGVYYIKANAYTIRTYYAGSGTLIPLKYQTAYMAPADGQTMQIQRIVAQVYCSSKLSGTINLKNNYILADGTSGTDTATITTVDQNTQGYSRINWTPAHSDVLGSSITIEHGSSEQKIVLVELLVYYKPDSEVMPLSPVTS